MGTESSPIVLTEARRYLVKGCRPTVFTDGMEFPVNREGPVGERQWMVVDGVKDLFRTQRHPGFEHLAEIQPSLEDDTLTLSKGSDTMNVPFDYDDGEKILGKVWDCEFDAVVHPEGSTWISDMIKKKCRLVRKRGARLIKRPAFAPAEMTANLADRFHLLMISGETLAELNALLGSDPVTMDRLRPNLIVKGRGKAESRYENRLRRVWQDGVLLEGVKPCERCPVVDIDQETGNPDLDERVTKVLLAHFRHPNGQKIFGENFIVRQPGTLIVGQPLDVTSWREKGWNRPYPEPATV